MKKKKETRGRKKGGKNRDKKTIRDERKLKSKNKKVMGRPKGSGGRRGKPPIKNIDFEQLENLCVLHCTSEEISGHFKISEDTLHTRIRENYQLSFSDFFKRFSAKGKISLRRKIYIEAMTKGNPRMMEFVAKHWLKMYDKVTISNVSEEELNQAIKEQLEKNNK